RVSPKTPARSLASPNVFPAGVSGRGRPGGSRWAATSYPFPARRSRSPGTRPIPMCRTLNDKTFLDNYRTPHTEKLHVIERWRMIDGGNRMEVMVRIEDPDTFNQPWSAVQHYRRVSQEMQEEACAENNAHLFDYHIPVADKSDF